MYGNFHFSSLIIVESAESTRIGANSGHYFWPFKADGQMDGWTHIYKRLATFCKHLHPMSLTMAKFITVLQNKFSIWQKSLPGARFTVNHKIIFVQFFVLKLSHNIWLIHRTSYKWFYDNILLSPLRCLMTKLWYIRTKSYHKCDTFEMSYHINSS